MKSANELGLTQESLDEQVKLASKAADEVIAEEKYVVRYYLSRLDCDTHYAAIDGVIVAVWSSTFKSWIERGVYRPVRGRLYYEAEWTGRKASMDLVTRWEEFQFVRKNKTEYKEPVEWT